MLLHDDSSRWMSAPRAQLRLESVTHSSIRKMVLGVAGRPLEEYHQHVLYRRNLGLRQIAKLWMVSTFHLSHPSSLVKFGQHLNTYNCNQQTALSPYCHIRKQSYGQRTSGLEISFVFAHRQPGFPRPILSLTPSHPSLVEVIGHWDDSISSLACVWVLVDV